MCASKQAQCGTLKTSPVRCKGHIYAETHILQVEMLLCHLLRVYWCYTHRFLASAGCLRWKESLTGPIYHSLAGTLVCCLQVPVRHGNGGLISQADIKVIYSHCLYSLALPCEHWQARKTKGPLWDTHLILKSSAASLALSISSMMRAFSSVFFRTLAWIEGW